jgi:hypothetical protein
MMINIKNVRNWILSIIMIASIGGALLTTTLPQKTFAASDCGGGVLGFPTWYRGLEKDISPCELKGPGDFNINGSKDGLQKYILIIGINIVEIVLIGVIYASAFFLLYGGFLFIISQGRPEGAANARKTMLNAIIGLIISMVAVAIASYISVVLTKGV